MDIEAALINMRATIKQATRELDRGKYVNPENHLAEDTISALIEHFEAIDGWLSHGGFLPPDWQRD